MTRRSSWFWSSQSQFLHRALWEPKLILYTGVCLALCEWFVRGRESSLALHASPQPTSSVCSPLLPWRKQAAAAAGTGRCQTLLGWEWTPECSPEHSLLLKVLLSRKRETLKHEEGEPQENQKRWSYRRSLSSRAEEQHESEVGVEGSVTLLGWHNNGPTSVKIVSAFPIKWESGSYSRGMVWWWMF